MTRKASYLELRKFSGKSLDDVVNYLNRDISKAFSDLFAILTQPLDEIGEIFEKDFSDVSAATTGAIFGIGLITPPKGTWLVTGYGFFVPGTVVTNTFFNLSASLSSVADATEVMSGTTGAGTLNIGLATFPLILKTNGNTSVYLFGRYDFAALGTSAVTNARMKAIRLA